MGKPSYVEQRIDAIRHVSLDTLRLLQDEENEGLARDEEIRRFIEFDYSGDPAVLRDW